MPRKPNLDLKNRSTERSSYAIGSMDFQRLTELSKLENMPKQNYLGTLADEIADGEYDDLITIKGQLHHIGIKAENATPALKHLDEINSKDSLRDILLKVLAIKYTNLFREYPNSILDSTAQYGDLDTSELVKKVADIQKEKNFIKSENNKLKKEKDKLEKEKINLENELKQLKSTLRKLAK